MLLFNRAVPSGPGQGQSEAKLSQELAKGMENEKDQLQGNGRLTITELAQHLGVSVKTILRWEKSGKIRKAPRDWRGWRVYAPNDLEQLKNLFETVY